MEKIDEAHEKEHVSQKKIPEIPVQFKGIISDAENADCNDDAGKLKEVVPGYVWNKAKHPDEGIMKKRGDRHKKRQN